ncbi:protein lin-54 homolog [Daktulosphaira vitifoliae]|uniref:protein lin-54 homolog n=1 Tax=Daktulosphaira vitifoliae TaxID=58002 RepID=UPI0021A9844C|nr:protein lin-54 homolog [Daktulosphaira vitifoliae]
MSNTDFDSQDLGGSSVLDSDYLTMLSSSDKLMSGEFEALERLQAELNLFDDPNRPEEIVEQMAVENHLDLIEEEVCSDIIDTEVKTEPSTNPKEVEPKSEIITPFQSQNSVSQAIKEEKLESSGSQHDNIVVSIRQKPEIVTVHSATKRSAPSSSGNQPSKKSLLTKVMVNSIPNLNTGKGTQQILLNVPVGQRPHLSTARTITLTQARQMGLLTPGCRLQPVTTNSSTTQNKSMLINKLSGTLKKVPSNLKSSVPTKILPAPTLITTKNSVIPQQKIYIRQGSVFKQGTIVTTNNGNNQVIRLPSIVGQASPVPTIQHIRLPTVNATNVSGLQQVKVPNNSGIQQVLPNKQVQYIRLVPTSTSNLPSAAVSVVTSTASSSLKQPQIVTVSAGTHKSIIKTTPTTKISLANNQHSLSNHIKVLTTSSPNTVTPSQQRPILPANKPSCSLPSESKKSNSDVSTISSITSKQVSTSSKTTLKVESIDEEMLSIKDENKELNLTPSLPKIGRPSSSTTTSTSIESKPKVINDLNKTKKPCNCTRSQCLKLYCDCFANGEFCYQCNCNSCFNNIEHEEDRAQAIRSVLDRNPNAFRPKIKSFVGQAERQHTKGCNCKRSGCLKNYCECFEARIACSQNCKCIGCRNIDEDSQISPFGDHSGSLSVDNFKSRSKSANFVTSFGSIQAANNIPSQPFKFFTNDVVQATCRCLLARGMEAKKLNTGAEECQRIIIEEFGQCLVKIMDLASEKSFA